MSLADKVLFLTGGGGGIGSACAKAVLKQDGKVVLTDVDESNSIKVTEALKNEFGEDKVVFIKCDVSDAENFKDVFGRAVEKFGKVDMIFNNAAIVDEINWQRTVGVNLEGVIIGTELAISHMRKDHGGQGGVVINMASDAGYGPFFGAPVYAATKHAVLGYTRPLANAPNIAAQGIRYACLCPGPVDTPMCVTFLKTCRQDFLEIAPKIMEREKTSPSKVAEGLISLLLDDGSNDVLLEVTLEHGPVRKKITTVVA